MYGVCSSMALSGVSMRICLMRAFLSATSNVLLVSPVDVINRRPGFERGSTANWPAAAWRRERSRHHRRARALRKKFLKKRPRRYEAEASGDTVTRRVINSSFRAAAPARAAHYPARRWLRGICCPVLRGMVWALARHGIYNGNRIEHDLMKRRACRRHGGR